MTVNIVETMYKVEQMNIIIQKQFETMANGYVRVVASEELAND